VADPVTSTTLVGAVVAACVGLVPIVVARLLGRRKDDADASESVATGAGAVTTAALALLEQMKADRDDCRAELARVNARIDEIHDTGVGRPAPPA